VAVGGFALGGLLSAALYAVFSNASCGGSGFIQAMLCPVALLKSFVALPIVVLGAYPWGLHVADSSGENILKLPATVPLNGAILGATWGIVMVLRDYVRRRKNPNDR
jgi:hypothetical protein